MDALGLSLLYIFSGERSMIPGDSKDNMHVVCPLLDGCGSGFECSIAATQYHQLFSCGRCISCPLGHDEINEELYTG